MSPTRTLIETIARQNGFAVLRGSQRIGKSAVSICFEYNQNSNLVYTVGVDSNLPDNRRTELWFEAGRKIERALEASGRFKVERILAHLEDAGTWGGRTFCVCPLVNLASLLPENTDLLSTSQRPEF